MQFSLKYHDGIFEVTTSGDATVQGYKDFAKAVLEHEKWKPGGLALLNHTALNTGTLTINEVEEIVNISKQNSEHIGEAKLAILASRDLDYGMTRMWQILIEMRGTWHATEKLFRDRDEAFEWLKSF